MLRGSGAVLLGFLVMALAVGLGTAAAANWMLSRPADGAPPRPTPSYIAVNLIVSGLAAILGGFTAARLAGRSPMVHAGVLALLLVVLSIITSLASGSQATQSNQPVWYPFAVAVLGATGVMAGGWLVR